MKEQAVTTRKKGEQVKIVALTGLDAAGIRKLTVFGLLPGTVIEVLQTFPAYVLKIGNTQLALDYETAAGILTVRMPSGQKK